MAEKRIILGATNGDYEQAKYIDDNYEVIASTPVWHSEWWFMELRQCKKGAKRKDLKKFIICYGDKRDKETGQFIGKCFNSFNKLDDAICVFAKLYHQLMN